jgi:hypothetical protein
VRQEEWWIECVMVSMGFGVWDLKRGTWYSDCPQPSKNSHPRQGCSACRAMAPYDTSNFHCLLGIVVILLTPSGFSRWLKVLNCNPKRLPERLGLTKLRHRLTQGNGTHLLYAIEHAETVSQYTSTFGRSFVGCIRLVGGIRTIAFPWPHVKDPEI